MSGISGTGNEAIYMKPVRRVLIDWDNPNIGGSWAIRKGLKLIVYGVLKGLGVKSLPKEIERETDDYALMLLRINDMAGVETVVGVRDPVRSVKAETVEKMISLGYDVRRHAHIGEPPDPDRKRIWEPPLSQSPQTWNYDREYVAGNPVELAPDELPIWHVDTPYWAKHYVNFLYNEFYSPSEKNRRATSGP